MGHVTKNVENYSKDLKLLNILFLPRKLQMKKKKSSMMIPDIGITQSLEREVPLICVI